MHLFVCFYNKAISFIIREKIRFFISVLKKEEKKWMQPSSWNTAGGEKSDYLMLVAGFKNRK